MFGERVRHLGFWIVSLVLIASQLAFSTDRPRAVMAYYEGSSSDDSLHSFYRYLTQLPTDSFAINGKGVVSGPPPSAALAFARKNGMQTFATVSNWSNSNFSSSVAHAILTHPVASTAAVQNMLSLVAGNGYSGINLDFEAVPAKDRAAFSAFVGALYAAMHGAGYLTVISVPAELKDDPKDSWAGAFDFATLGGEADVLQLMTYDENGPWGPPGPVAGLDWVKACARYAVSVVPSSKISLGMPAYGYDWNLTKGGGNMIYWRQIPSLIARVGATPQWDAKYSSPYFTYTTPQGASHIVWYENTESVPLKSRLAVTYNLAGVSVYALGFDDISYWEAVSAGLGASPPQQENASFEP